MGNAELKPSTSLCQFGGAVTALAWSKDLSRIAVAALPSRQPSSADVDPIVKVLDFAVLSAARQSQEAIDPDTAFISEFKGHKGMISELKFTSHGKLLLSACKEDFSAKVWDSITGAKIRSLKRHTGSVNACCWAPDDVMVVTASDDQTCRVWEAEKGKTTRILAGHTGRVVNAVWSPDGKRILTCSDDTFLKMWDPDSGEKLRTFRGHTGKVTCCDWSPDSQCVVSVAEDGFIIIWNPKNTKQLMVLKGFHETSRLCYVKWSFDGRFIATADVEGMICVWDISTSSCVRVLNGHVGKVNCLVWSQDDRRILLSGGEDGHVYLWENNLIDVKASLSTIRESRPTAVSSVDGRTTKPGSVSGGSEGKDSFDHSSRVRSIEEDDVVVVHHDPAPEIESIDIKQSAIISEELKQSFIFEDKGPVLMSSIFDLSETLPRSPSSEEHKSDSSFKEEAAKLQQEIQRMDVEYKVSTNHMQNLVEQSEDLATTLSDRTRELEELAKKFTVLRDTLQVFFVAYCKILLGIFCAKCIHDMSHNFWSSVLFYPFMCVVYYVVVKFVGLEVIQEKVIQEVVPKLKKSPQPALLAFALYWTHTGGQETFFSLRLITDSLLLGSVLFEVKNVERMWPAIWQKTPHKISQMYA